MKLGFLFLCKNDIHQLQLWLEFFKNNYDKCNIYIHSYDQDNITQDFVKKYHIDKVLPTGWGDIYEPISYCMNMSIQNNDYKLVLLSESTIPTKPFNYIYDYLTKDDKGYLSYNMTNQFVVTMQTNRYKNNCKNIKGFEKAIDFSHWYYNETWITFNKEMMEIILEDITKSNYYSYFKYAFVYDENYPIYLYSLYDKLDLFHNSNITYVNWNTQEVDGIKHPKSYEAIDEGLLNILSNPNILFARKFTDDITIYNTLVTIISNDK